jgi:hypothetical protein
MLDDTARSLWRHLPKKGLGAVKTIFDKFVPHNSLPHFRFMRDEGTASDTGVLLIKISTVPNFTTSLKHLLNGN